MKLRGILDLLIAGEQAVNLEDIEPYRRSIRTYLQDYFGSRFELCIIPVFVTNACCGVIVGCYGEIFDALEKYGENVSGYHEAEATGNFDLDTDGIETTLSYVSPL